MLNQTMQHLGEAPSVIRETFEYGNALAQKIGRENVYDFSLGNPSTPPPDCVRQTIAALNDMPEQTGLHGYTSAPGDPAVRSAIALDLQKRFGAQTEAEDIYMTCGAAASLTISLHALCIPGDEVITIAPFFPEYRVFVEGTGAKLVAVKAKEPNFSIDFAALAQSITPRTKAILLNTPNNPTGTVLSEDVLRHLGALLREKSAQYGTHIYLISDEPYRELVWEAPSAPHAMTDYYDNVLICYSFSKSLSLPGERIGYIAVGTKTFERIPLHAAIAGAARMLGFVCAPAMLQRVVAAHPDCTADFTVYRKNRDRLCSGLRAMGFSFAPPQGAFYLFLRTPEPDANAFCHTARKERLLFVPSDSFGVKGYARIAYCVDTEMLDRALPAFARLAAAYGLSAT